MVMLTRDLAYKAKAVALVLFSMAQAWLIHDALRIY